MKNKESFQLPLSLASALALVACNMQGEASSAQNGGICVPGEKLGTSEAGLELLQLCITSDESRYTFAVEHAETPAQQAKGLMFRTSLADNAGMVFPYPKEQMLSFWMKNTVIPLDIIFIRADGTIESIAENTTPYSEESVSSKGPTIAVLELRGGLTAQMGIKAGDKVAW